MAFLDLDGLSRFKSKLETIFASITHSHNNATQSAAGFMSADDKTKLDEMSVSEAVYIEENISIAVNAWTGNGPYTYTHSNALINAHSGLDVFYRSGARESLVGDIDFTKVSGGVQFTVSELPVGAVPLRIRIINSSTDSVIGLEAANISTDAVTGQTNVQGALESLVTSSDNIKEYASSSSFPATGAAKNIYIDKSDNSIYRWDTTAQDYVAISSSSGSGAAIADLNVTIPADGWSSNSPYTYTYSSSTIKADSYISIYFNDSSRSTNIDDLSFTHADGSVTFTTYTLPSAAVSLVVRVFNITDLEYDYTTKADKVSGATNGNLAGLDSNGNLTDSGYSVSTLGSTHNHDSRYYTESEIDTQVQGLNARIDALDPEQGVGIFTDVAFTIQLANWTAGTNDWTYTYTNPVITARSGVDVMYDSSIRTAIAGDIDAVKNTGNIVFTTNRQPLGALSGVIRVFDSVQGVLTVDKGGTGATSAANARTNLGIYAENIPISSSDNTTVSSSLSTLSNNLTTLSDQIVSMIKVKNFDVTATTGSTALGSSGIYKGAATLPSVTGSIVGVVVTACYDTTYFDSSCWYSIYQSNTIIAFATAASRGVEIKGNILYI